MMEGPIQLGSTCLLRDLQAEPTWNGLMVQVVEFQMDQGRFLVQPADSGSPLPPSLAIRPQNLKPVDSSPDPLPCLSENELKPGATCTLQGLKTAAFNGETVMILKYIPAEQRYQVRPLSPETKLPPLMAIKPENLHSERDLTRQSSRRSLFSMFRKKSESKLKSDARSVHSAHYDPMQLTHEGQQLKPVGSTRELLPSGSVPNLVDLAGDDTGSLTDSFPTTENDTFQQPAVESLPPRMGGLLRAGSVPNLGSNSSYNSFCGNRSLRDLNDQGSSVFSATLLRSELNVGSMARLKGLQTQAGLNGAIVVIQEFVEEHSRYRVRMLDDDDDATVNGRDMMIHRRNLQEITELDVKSATSSVSQSSTDFLPSEHLRLTGLRSRPTLNGQLVEVLESVSDGNRYRVRPTDLNSADSADIGVLSVFRENLIRDESSGDSELLAYGVRVVLQQVPDQPALRGELATVLQFMPERKEYRIRLLGATAVDKHGGVNELQVPRHCVQAAPFASMWVNMVIQGNTWRVPSVCEVANGLIRVRLDTFAGIDRVVPIAKRLMGEDKCDWMNDDEVDTLLRESASSPLSCTVVPHRNEIMVDPSFQSRSPFFKAMMEYELLQSTGMRTGTGDRSVGAMDVFQVLFPLGAVNLLGLPELAEGCADDENPFGGPEEDTEIDVEQLSLPSQKVEPLEEVEPPLYVSQRIEYDLVDEPLHRPCVSRCPSPTLVKAVDAARSVRKPDPPGRQGDDSDPEDEGLSVVPTRSHERGRDPTTSSRESRDRARSKSRTKSKKKKTSSRSRSKSTSRLSILYTSIAPLKVPAAHE